MTKTEDTELTTSEEARAAGLRRIARRHKANPGEIQLKDCKVLVTMYLDADVLNYFKNRAGESEATQYQTQINNELRRVMEEERQGEALSAAAFPFKD